MKFDIKSDPSRIVNPWMEISNVAPVGLLLTEEFQSDEFCKTKKIRQLFFAFAISCAYCRPFPFFMDLAEQIEHHQVSLEAITRAKTPF